jgi:iron complex outermembrane receptor protein
MKIHTLWLSASVLALGWCGAAVAQTTAPAPQDKAKAESIQEVVVTAERRTTNLQTTPIAATVLTGADLAKKGVFSIDQLQFVSPSLTVNNFGQGNDVDIRGIGKGEHNSQTGTGVVTYRDGAATTPGYLQDEPYFDIASIEVLRGPQGTFSGQNATGGAIIVNTVDPKINGGYTGYLLGRYGNYNDAALQGAINIPIDDTLAARVAFNGEHRSSFYHISGPWTGDPDVNYGSARLSVLWTPTPQIKLLLKTDYDYMDNGGYFGDSMLDQGTSHLFSFANNHKTFATDQLVRTTLKADYVDPGSGITLRSVSSFTQGRTAWQGDIDGTSFMLPQTPTLTSADEFIDEAVDERQYSEEINLISPEKGLVTWILGAYYANNQYTFPPGQFVIGLPYPYGLNEDLEGVNNTHSTSGFGQVSLNLPSGFQIQAGVRYTGWYTANDPVRYYVPSLVAYGYDFHQNEQYTGSNVTGKIALNWTLDSNNFLYAFIASGAKPGGLNTALYFGALAGVTPAPFKQEYVTDYEVGWKTKLLKNHVRLQTGFFYNDFRHFQVSLPIPTVPTEVTEQNVPTLTTLYGFEASAQAVFGDFTGSMGMDVQKSSLGTFYSVDTRVVLAPPATCGLTTGPTGGGCVNYSGNSQTYAPDFTFNAAAAYNFHVNNNDLLTPSVTYAHISSQWATLYENRAEGDYLAARDIWGASLAWTHADYVLSFYAYNLFDDKYVAAVVSPIRIAGAPRQFGVSLLKTF